MSFIESVLSIWEVNRERTLETLQAIETLDDPQAALAFRPGPERAHIAWQLMHIAVTEELFATSRFLGIEPSCPELCERFQRGSSASDDDVPTLAEIRDTLSQTREHLKATMAKFTDGDLESIPAALAERGWTLCRALQIVTWHEGHHQGQAHLTLNIFKAQT
ncbi:MAG: DinB family protein, partial [Planctomycetota bacterium]